MDSLIERRRVLAGALMLMNQAARPEPAPRPFTEEASSYDPDTVRKWFSATYFNLLIDYYTEVWCRPYGSGFTRDNLLPAFQMARPGFAITYAKGHSGTTAFRSRLGTEHPMLRGDPLAIFRSATREAGVKMLLYYSGLIDGKAAESHPEWRALDRNGKPHDGGEYHMVPVCPNSRYFEEWLAVHLQEIMTRYEPDGIWVDGDWGGGGACYCARCRDLCTARFSQDAIQGVEFHNWARNEFRRKFAAAVRGYRRDCLYSAGNTSPAVNAGLTNHMDWQSGDWFTPDGHRIMQSLAMRRYTTLGLPYDAMTCDTQYIHSFKDVRSRVKTVDRMMQEGAGILANGGKWCYWTYPLPNGALIPSRMRVAKACRDFARERESVWLNTQSVRWTAAVDTVGRPIFGNDSCLGASKALVELHRSPDLIHLRQLKPPLPHELLVIANQPGLTSDDAGILEEYVRGGGNLLVTGSTAMTADMQQLLGIRILSPEALDEGHVLLRDGTPAGICTAWNKVELAGAESWAKLYKSWDHGNTKFTMSTNYPITGILDEEHPEEAGFPAVTARRVGRGLAIYITGDPFAEYWTGGYPTTRRWVGELLDRVQPVPLIRCDAPSWVELSLRVRPGELLIHFVNGNPGRDLSKVGARDLFVDEIPVLGATAVALRCDRQPDEVVLEPGGVRLQQSWSGNLLRFSLPEFRIHSCVRVRPWPVT